MKKLSIALHLGLVALVGAQVNDDGKLTLEEAIAIGEKNSFSIQTAQAKLRQTKARAQETVANTRPRLSLGADYSRTFNEGVSGGFGDPRVESKSVSAGIAYPFSLASRLLAGSVKTSISAAEFSVEAARNDLKLSIRRAYLNVLRAQASIGVIEQSLATARAQLKQANQRLAEGDAAKLEVVRADSQVAQFESDLLGAQNSLRLAKDALNLALSRPVETPLETLEDVTAFPVLDVSSEEAVAYASKNRPDVRSQERTIAYLAVVREATAGGNAPSVTLGLNYRRTLGELGFNTRDYTAATLSISWPIFDGGITKARTKQAREDEKQAQIGLDSLKLAISQEVRAAVTSLDSARARFQAATRAVNLAEELLRISLVKRQAGEGIQLEVLDAETQVLSARNRLISARYDYMTSFAELQRALGIDDPAAAKGSGEKGEAK